MPDPVGDAACLAAARRGSKKALGELLEKYRNYLILIARQELDAKVRAKGGASDLVQETFLEAQRDFAQFQGDREEELLAWLKQLLHNNLVNFARRYRAGKRRVSREASLDARSPSRRPDPPAPGPAPDEHAAAEEQSRRVRDALARLPGNHRRVLLLRCRDNLSFEEIGKRMKRSTNAAQKLWARAVERLEREMGGGRERRE